MHEAASLAYGLEMCTLYGSPESVVVHHIMMCCCLMRLDKLSDGAAVAAPLPMPS